MSRGARARVCRPAYVGFERLGRCLALVLGCYGLACDAAPPDIHQLVAELPHAREYRPEQRLVDSDLAARWRDMLEAALDHDERALSLTANAAGFEWLRATQGRGAHLVLFDPRGIEGALVLSRTPRRDLVFEVPHPLDDRATDREGVAMYVASGARALVIAGAHRCADPRASTCSGKTGRCNGRRAYRLSDAAHQVSGFFHLTHRVLNERWSQALTIQLHGFGNPASPVWFLLSDTTHGTAPPSAPVHRLRDVLRRELGDVPVAVSCQDPADADVPTRRLCARTNVQGRWSNASPDPCHQGVRSLVPEGAVSRFVHIEQTFAPVREPFRDTDAASALQFPGPRALARAFNEVGRCLRPDCAPVVPQ